MAKMDAPHKNLRSTKSFDRRSDDITLDEIEKISFSPVSGAYFAPAYPRKPPCPRGAVRMLRRMTCPVSSPSEPGS
jgi:hypothetical protein